MTFGRGSTALRIKDAARALGYEDMSIQLRMAGDAPVKTDSGNVVYDCAFGAIKDANLVEADLTRYRSIALSKVAADPDGLSKILSALEWMDEQIVRHPSS